MSTTEQRAKFRDLMPYLREHQKILLLVIVLSILGAGASLAQPLLVSTVITLVSAGSSVGEWVWFLVALVIASALLSGLQHYLLQRTGEGVVFSARRRLITKILRLPISAFDARRTGDLVSRVGSDTTLLRAVLTQGLVEAVGGSLTFIGAVIAMLIIDPVLLGLTVLVVGVSLVVVIVLSARIRVASQQAQEKVGNLAASVERAISAVRTVRAANATERETKNIEKEAESAYRLGLAVARISALVVPIAGIALQVAFLTVIGVGGFRVASGATTIAALVSFMLFLFMMILPLGQAFGAITSVNAALGALGRIQEIITLPNEEDTDHPTEPMGTAQENILQFEDVHFSYAEGTAVLHGINFVVPQGKRTALVGLSGAGKSTILSLIERFYEPTSGSIRLNETDIRSLKREEIRAQIGYVEQDAPVLAGTFRENLLLASPGASDEQCLKVLGAVNLLDVVERNERGLDTQVGENGVLLSGGERQRLALARTLLAAQPILLLDESTSNLDGLNEELLRKAVDAVAENRTLVVIAHRLSTVVDSDQIIVLEQGRIIGTGTHSELLESTPLYRNLAERQLLV